MSSLNLTGFEHSNDEGRSQDLPIETLLTQSCSNLSTRYFPFVDVHVCILSVAQFHHHLSDFALPEHQ